ncbi:MAG: tetraacyldisaccharide 4'-kinase, partial [Myxococcota bacterium]|nr:tetraacyldisaccharide 4'-kinase [Myxococcota bacterium]
AYSGGWAVSRQLPCRVVSVGSLLAGGSGKTPVTAWVAGRLRARGHRVVIATRGYGRSGRDAVHTLSDGSRVHGDVVGVGDEALVLAAHAADVPVLVGRDRGVVGLRAVSSFDADVLVLDDGFQHHRLSRDVDIVTLDAGSGFGNRRILPRGPLREPASALARAHAIGIIDGRLSDGDAAFLERHAVSPHVFQARRRAARLCRIGVPAKQGEPATALAGERVGMLAALGQPAAFRRTLEEQGATVIAERTFRDHHRYRARDLRDLKREAQVWVTTQKDAVKILPRWVRGVDLRVLTIDLAVASEDVFLDWLEARLR